MNQSGSEVKTGVHLCSIFILLECELLVGRSLREEVLELCISNKADWYISLWNCFFLYNL